MSFLDDAVPILLQTPRSIGYLFPDVVIEERVTDNAFITQHPVERGATISDHAFLLPTEIQMTAGWSDSTVGFTGYADAAYAAILALQAAREPFVVTTPSRIYQDMLISGIERQTTEATSNVLLLRVTMRKVIIVSTQLSSVGTPASASKHGGVTSGGQKQAQPSSFSYAGNGG